MNLRGIYGYDITGKGLFDLYGTVDASVGLINIYAKPMVHARFGKFAPIQFSVAQDNQLLGEKDQIEYFIDTGFGAKISAYNATVQGNIFDSDELFSQDELNNLIFNGYFGVCFLYNKTSIEMKYHLTTGELKSSEVTRYGSICIAQRF